MKTTALDHLRKKMDKLKDQGDTKGVAHLSYAISVIEAELMGNKPNEVEGYPYVHKFPKGNWKEDMFCEQLREDPPEYRMLVSTSSDTTIAVTGKNSDEVVSTARALAQFPNMVQCAESLHARFSKSDSLIGAVVNKALGDAGILKD